MWALLKLQCEDSTIRINIEPYLRLTRLHRPVGIWLLMLPAWWGLALANPEWAPPFSLFFLFGCGAVLMRSAGCVYNDMIDKDFDVKVKRTSLRPLATGEVSLKAAFIFLMFLLAGGALILFSLPVISLALPSNLHAMIKQEASQLH